MRGFILGLFTSVGVVLLSGQFQLTPSAAHRTASAEQPQETVSGATSREPTPAADRPALEPQIARELLNLRRQLGNGWRSDVNGEGAFLKALEQVARDDTTAVSEPSAGARATTGRQSRRAGTDNQQAPRGLPQHAGVGPSTPCRRQDNRSRTAASPTNAVALGSRPVGARGSPYGQSLKGHNALSDRRSHSGIGRRWKRLWIRDSWVVDSG